MSLDFLNDLAPEAACAEFLRCCGSPNWARAMTMQRPFREEAHLFAEAEEIWNRLAAEDWREAFAQHPKIGDLQSLRAKFGHTREWAEGEQSGVRDAAEAVVTALAEENRLYENKFGYIFIVCATGKRAEEMLAALRNRLQNDPAIELQIAAAEQCKITRLRLEKLLKN